MFEPPGFPKIILDHIGTKGNWLGKTAYQLNENDQQRWNRYCACLVKLRGFFEHLRPDVCEYQVRCCQEKNMDMLQEARSQSVNLKGTLGWCDPWLMRESSDHHLMEEKAWGCELDHTEPVKHPHLTLKALNSLQKWWWNAARNTGLKPKFNGTPWFPFFHKLRRDQKFGRRNPSDQGIRIKISLCRSKSTKATPNIYNVYTLYPIGSMYGIYANIGGILMVNVTIYSIHGSYGIYKPLVEKKWYVLICNVYVSTYHMFVWDRLAMVKHIKSLWVTAFQQSSMPFGNLHSTCEGMN